MQAKREMTLPEAARALGRSWAATYRLVLTGVLRVRQVNGRYLVCEEDVEGLRRESARGGTATAVARRERRTALRATQSGS